MLAGASFCLSGGFGWGWGRMAFRRWLRNGGLGFFAALRMTGGNGMGPNEGEGGIAEGAPVGDGVDSGLRRNDGVGHFDGGRRNVAHEVPAFSGVTERGRE